MLRKYPQPPQHWLELLENTTLERFPLEIADVLNKNIPREHVNSDKVRSKLSLLPVGNTFWFLIRSNVNNIMTFLNYALLYFYSGLTELILLLQVAFINVR